MKYKRLMSKDDLTDYLDDILIILGKTHQKTKTITDAPDRVISSVVNWIESPDGYLLLAVDDNTIKGLLFAVCMRCSEPWIEVVTLWTASGIGLKLRFEVMEMLKVWARDREATRIVTIITRSPERFSKMFHEPLGFKTVGLVLEVDLNAD